ncbi:hypothetical protein [Bradyrhizobium sp.]|uniref:hypothetical protein n=1 Tax=Bradyrhizobium sp. TaxID=376 RepID=UPI003C3D09E8
MNEPDNDNELFSFITIAAATANVIRYLENCPCQNADRKQDGATEQDDKKEPDEARDYVEQRVRELEEFENRARGVTPHRRSRPSRR